MKTRIPIILGLLALMLAGGLTFAHERARSGNEQPKVVEQLVKVIGTDFHGAGVTIEAPPTETPPISETRALDTAWTGSEFGDQVTEESATLGLAVPDPGLGMLAKPTLVWVVAYNNACVWPTGPVGGSPSCGGYGYVFVDATAGNVWGQLG